MLYIKKIHFINLLLIFICYACSSSELIVFSEKGQKNKLDHSIPDNEINLYINSNPLNAELYYQLYFKDEPVGEKLFIGKTPINQNIRLKLNDEHKQNSSKVKINFFITSSGYKDESMVVPLDFIIRNNHSLTTFFDLNKKTTKRIEILGGIGGALSFDTNGFPVFFYIHNSLNQEPDKLSQMYSVNFLTYSLESPIVFGFDYEKLEFRNSLYTYQMNVYSINLSKRKYWGVFYLGGGFSFEFSEGGKVVSRTNQNQDLYSPYVKYIFLNIAFLFQFGLHFDLSENIGFQVAATIKPDILPYYDSDSQNSFNYSEIIFVKGYLIKTFLQMGLNFSF